ncbi:MAG: hypothetical protein AAGB25_09100 [Pseudomonadota bacterium]
MTHRFLNLLRVTACSVAAIAMTACARFTAPSDLLASGEPKRADAPDDAPAKPTLRGLQEADNARLAMLESDIQTLNAEIADLRAALDLMGPFDDIAAGAQDLVDPQPMTDLSAGQGAIDLSEIYAPAPKLKRGHSLFHSVELAVYPTVSAAKADWARLTSEIDLSGLSPRFLDDDNQRVRLSAGPVMSAIAAEALCADLSARAGACAPSDQWGAIH